MVVNYSWISKTRLFYEYEYVSADRLDAPLLVSPCLSLRFEVIKLSSGPWGHRRHLQFSAKSRCQKDTLCLLQVEMCLKRISTSCFFFSCFNCTEIKL